MLSVAQIRADSPVDGWLDPQKVIHQIEVFRPSNVDAALRDLPRTWQRVNNQVAEVRRLYGSDARLYLDVEPGDWTRVDAQEFAMKLREEYPSAKLFPGASFDLLVQNDTDRARAIANSGDGLLYPVYHSNASIVSHIKVWSPRLSRLAEAGITPALSVSRLYNDAVGPVLARTPVPLSDFLLGVSLCARFASEIVVWQWFNAWNNKGNDELRTGMTAGDQDIVVLMAQS